MTQLHVVTCFEVADAQAARGVAVLKDYVARLGGDGGAMHAAAFQELGQANRFVVSKVWTSETARAQWNADAAHSPVADIEIAPADIRLHHAWSIGEESSSPADAVYVFTHVDVPPPHLPGLEAIFRPFVEDSRKEKGAMRFDALQSTSRPNHFTLIEVWASEEHRRAHAAAVHVREFRAALTPMLGALYDQRLFTLIA